jgi:hypothetical protein
MELDIFLPKEGIAFEYHGEQHYFDIYTLGRGWNQRQRDEEKRIGCREHSISLVEIPYWWDRTEASLRATIYHHRPDLLPWALYGNPISMEPAAGFTQG